MLFTVPWYAELRYFRRNIFDVFFRITLPSRHCRARRYPWPFMISFFEPAENVPSHISRSARVVANTEPFRWFTVMTHFTTTASRRVRINEISGAEVATNNRKLAEEATTRITISIEFLQKDLHISVILFRFFRVSCRFSNCYPSRPYRCQICNSLKTY